MDNVTAYLDILNETHGDYIFNTTVGKRYIKVIQRYHISPQETVHSFIDKNTLDLYKAASWNSPAKGARYNLNRDIEKLPLA